MLVLASHIQGINAAKQAVASHYTIKDLGEIKFILGMEITRNRNQKTNMQDANSATTPLPLGIRLQHSPPNEEKLSENVPYRAAVGSLMHAMVCTRPDIARRTGQP